MSYTVYPSAQTHADYVVLSSGLGGHGSFWQPQIAVLQQYFHVVTYDQEGCHHDSAPLPADYSVQHLAQQLLSLVLDLNIKKFHFIGHALGGHIGFALAPLAEQYGVKLLSLSVINGWAELSPHTQKCFQARIALLQHAGAEAYVRAQVLFLYPPAYIAQHNEQITAAENKQLQDFPPIPNVMARLNAVQQFHLSTQMIAAVQHIPIYVIANTDDFLVPVEQSRQLVHKIPHAKYFELASGAHASTITETATINAQLIACLA